MATPPAAQGEQPLYQAKHRIPVNLTLILALGVAAYGVFVALRGGEAAGEGGRLVLVGLLVAAILWFTSPRQYRIYSGSLVVVYGTPRVRVIPFQKISHLEMLRLMIGDRLRVRMAEPLAMRLFDRRRVILELRDPETFHNQLQAALDEFRRTHPELEPGGQRAEDRPSY
jgi:hypothetical protein